MTENNVQDLFTEKDEADVVKLFADGEEPAPEEEGGEQPPYNSILKLWRSMLDPEQQLRHLPPSPDWCAVMIARWTFLRFADMGTVQDEYFRIFDEAHKIIEAVYLDTPEAFEVDNREDDVENKDIYVHLIKDFQRALLVAQSEWSYDDPNAGAKMAALGEAQQNIVGKNGLASYLGEIGLPFTQEEQDDMNQELAEFRQSLEV